MENLILDMIMAHPMVSTIVGLALTWFAVLFTVSKTAGAIAVLCRPLVKLTPTKKDDKWLEIIIYWLDVLEDMFEVLSVGKWRKAWDVGIRVKEDLSKPYKERRKE